MTEPTYELTTIDPERARGLLELNNHNRNVRERVVKKYAVDMTNGDWDGLNGQTIVLADDGRVVDGQHRLLAIIQSDTTQRMLVVWGVPMSAQLNVDTQAKRSFADQLKLDGESNPVALAAATRQVALWQSGVRRAIGHGYQVPTNTQLLNTIHEYPDLRVSAAEADKTRRRIAAPASVLGLCHWAFSRIDYDDAQHFFALIKGEHDGLERGHPVRTLLDTVNASQHKKDRLSSTVLTVYFIKSWNAYREGRALSQLRYRPGGAAPEAFPEPA